jgi:hypothetical protein
MYEIILGMGSTVPGSSREEGSAIPERLKNIELKDICMSHTIPFAVVLLCGIRTRPVKGLKKIGNS